MAKGVLANKKIMKGEKTRAKRQEYRNLFFSTFGNGLRDNEPVFCEVRTVAVKEPKVRKRGQPHFPGLVDEEEASKRNFYFTA